MRMRIDGVLRTILTVPKELQASVISRLKIMGGMNTSERRVPQDGRANIRLKKQDIDLRINTLPTIHGETVVIRLLDKNESLFDPKGIGLAGSNLEKYNRLIHANNGMVLIVGPTGSGKSSTMYTMIRELNDDSVNLVTLEDPVEYNIDGANQVQINEKTGMTFASGLRAILRQDPDIVAVGAIRDGETAEIAMRAAITGHLVLSTVHTFDAASTIDRLVDIGVEPYLIASGVRGVISQRLVRKVCPHCREEYRPSPEEFEAIGLRYDPGVRFYRGSGCPMCFGTGYRGRTGVFEILVIDRALRSRITGGATREELKDAIERTGSFKTMEDSCRELVLTGVTTVEEARKTITALE